MVFLLLACSEPPAAPEERVAAADRAILASAAELGSYQSTASVLRTWTGKEGATRSLKEDFELRWEDPDRWSLILSRDGRQTQRAVVFGGVPYLSIGDRPLERRGDAEPLRVQLAAAWNPWEQAIQPFADQLGYVEAREDLWEGRAVRVFTLSAKAPPPKSRPSWVIREVQGEVWLDEATSVRLKADLKIGAQGKKEALEMVFSLQVTGIGSPTSLTDPAGEAALQADERRLDQAPPPRPPQPPRPGM